MTALTLAVTLLCGGGSIVLKAGNKVSAAPLEKIIVDAGHGGFDGGAVARDGTVEAALNLEISRSLSVMLRFFGYDVINTRTDDNGTQDDGLHSIRAKKRSDIHNRLSLVEATDAALFVSIHQNTFYQSKYSGTQVFYGGNSEQSKIAAECIRQSVLTSLQKDNSRSVKRCGSDIYLMYHTTKPAVLVECGFMSNTRELELLKDCDYQKKLCICVVQGILEYTKNGDRR